MDPAGELAQLLDRELELRRGLIRRGDRLGVLAGPSGEPSPDAAQRERDRDEPLLGAVVEVALQPAALLVGRLDDPRPRAADLGLDGPHLREVADDRGDLVRAARGDPGLELAPAAGQVQGEVVGLESTRFERIGRRLQRPVAGDREHRLVESAAHRHAGAIGRLGIRVLGGVGEVRAVAVEPDHPIRDRVDDRPQPPLALAVEPDQQRHRDGRRRQVPGRDQDRRHVLGHVGDPADEVDDQDRQEDEPGDEDRQELPSRARGRDQPAPDDHDGRHRREGQAAVEPGRARIDVEQRRREEEVEAGRADGQDRDGRPIDASMSAGRSDRRARAPAAGRSWCPRAPGRSR